MLLPIQKKIFKVATWKLKGREESWCQLNITMSVSHGRWTMASSISPTLNSSTHGVAEVPLLSFTSIYLFSLCPGSPSLSVETLCSVTDAVSVVDHYGTLYKIKRSFFLAPWPLQLMNHHNTLRQTDRAKIWLILSSPNQA